MRKTIEASRSVYTLVILMLLIGLNTTAKSTFNALFLGNSYTGYNNLPQLTSDLALSVGDTLNVDSYTPGGYTLFEHSNDNISQSKIANGNWDFVVLQEQSRTPITNSTLFANGLSQLNSYTKQQHPCAVMMPYITWGRKNGDATFCPYYPIMCTYEGMDTTIRDSYLEKSANILFGEVSPVSVVWSYIRQNYPSIELYAADESHPSLAGSYAAACCFYAAIFKKDPTFISNDYGLDPIKASNIRTAAKHVVFDQLNLWNFKQLPTPDIGFSLGSGLNEVYFQTETQGVYTLYEWDFGDGTTSTIQNPVHSYASNGTYQVTLNAYTCDQYGRDTTRVDTTLMFCSHTPTIYHLGPLLCRDDTLWTQAADEYEWYGYNDGILQGEVHQFLHYPSYPSNYTFGVRTTVNGCSELSVGYNIFPNRDFYFYHNFGLGSSWNSDPCVGDTAFMHVVPSDYTQMIDGLETIQWFKDGALLPQWTNVDTLLITEGGTYTGWIVDTTSDCPKDTTFSMVVSYDCGTVGVEPIKENRFDTALYPNPATNHILLELNNDFDTSIRIYSIEGVLVREIKLTSSNTILNIEKLAAGIYFVQFDDPRYASVKFIKQ